MSIAGEIAKMVGEQPPRSSTHRATVLRTDNDGTTWVSIPGGADETPLHGTLVECAPGDVVDVTIANGRATATANATSPAATGRTVGVVRQTAETAQLTADGAVTRVERLEADHVSVADLEAEHALIVELDADKASIADLSAATARIGTLESNTADIGTIRANAAKVQNLTAAELEADHAKVGRLDADQIAADHATLGTVSADYLKAADMTAERARVDTLLAGKADISTLEADYITAAQIEAGYMHADMANADVAWIANGTIKDGAIVNAMIASVSANKLTAGTIDASNITVTNLNADNITTGTINGQRIGQGSLSLDKLSEDVYTESEVDAKLSTMQDQIDGAIETWTGTAVPTLNNAPANGWTTAADRDKHVGDVYFVVNSQSQQNGYNYRFTKSGSTYSWQLIKDSDVTAALQRLSTVEGEITQFDEDISTLQTDTGSLKTRTTSLETRMTTAEGSISDKVDTATFNELSSTVDSNTASITSLSSTVQQKADSSTVTALSNTVNTVSQTATSNSSKISQLTTTLGTNADGTTKAGDVVHRTSAIEQDVSGFKQTVSETYATQASVAQSVRNLCKNTAKPTVKQATSTTMRLGDDWFPFASGNGTISKTADGVRLDYDNTTVTAGIAIPLVNEAEIADGERLTLSFTYRGTLPRMGSVFLVHVNNPNSTQGDMGNLVADGEWHHWERSFSFVRNASATTRVAALLVGYYRSAAGTWFEIKDGTLVLERGDMATRVSSAESAITQNATNIELKVSKDGVISSINQSAESVTIQASKVNVAGMITAINGDTTTTIDGGKIAANSLAIGATSGLQTALDGKATTGSVTSAANAANTIVTVYPTAIDYAAGTATLAVKCMRGATAVTPSAYKWTKGTATASLGTGSTLAVTDLDAVYNCTVTFSA